MQKFSKAILATTLALSMGAFSMSVTAAPGPTVSIHQGALSGSRAEGVESFKGIPYAAPPTGKYRWRAPRLPEPWKGVRDATAFGPACIQRVAPKGPEHTLTADKQSEDCLTLNIWRPAHSAGKKLPVMVWIHGGSFRFGSGSLAAYDGSELAKQGVIVVTINYRLGLFGTFNYPGLHPTGEAGGNYGLLDAIAALKWVRSNISAFNGDPDKVTLFGESAGGVSVSYLMGSRLARGLFQRAIMESGGLSLPEYSEKHATAFARKTAKDLGADSTVTLRALPASALRDVQYAPAETMPFIDGKVIREKAVTGFEKGHAARVPLLIGSNSAEAGFFGPRYWKKLPQDLGTTAWNRLKHLCFSYGKLSEKACKEQVASEWFAGQNSRKIARAASAHAPVYMYRFAWVPFAERAHMHGAIHTAEIPYVFGHAANNPKLDVESRAISRKLMASWVAFAKTGKPDTEALHFPRFVAEKHEDLLRIGPHNLTPGPNPAANMLDALDEIDPGPRP